MHWKIDRLKNKNSLSVSRTCLYILCCPRWSWRWTPAAFCWAAALGPCCSGLLNMGMLWTWACRTVWAVKAHVCVYDYCIMEWYTFLLFLFSFDRSTCVVFAIHFWFAHITSKNHFMDLCLSQACYVLARPWQSVCSNVSVCDEGCGSYYATTWSHSVCQQTRMWSLWWQQAQTVDCYCTCRKSRSHLLGLYNFSFVAGSKSVKSLI